MGIVVYFIVVLQGSSVFSLLSKLTDLALNLHLGPDQMTCIPGKGWNSWVSPYCIPICGKPVHAPFINYEWRRGRIIGGSIAKPHTWPWHVAIEVR